MAQITLTHRQVACFPGSDYSDWTNHVRQCNQRFKLFSLLWQMRGVTAEAIWFDVIENHLPKEHDRQEKMCSMYLSLLARLL